MKKINLCNAFYAQARRHPGRPAIIQGMGRSRREMSYGEFAASVRALAGGLQARGFKAGDRVLVFVPMSLELYQFLMACFHLGISAVFLDAWSDKGRLAAAVALANPKAMAGSPKAQILRLLSARLRSIPTHWVIGGPFFPLDRMKAAPIQDPVALPSGHEALVTFTTGSTGQPKGAARSHAFLLSQAAALTRSFGSFPGTVDMPTLPAFVLLNLFQGATSVIAELDPRKAADCDPAVVLEQMAVERVESSSGSPALYERLAGAGRMPLKRLFTGGAAVPPALAKKLAGACDGEVQVVYGSTEAEPIAHCLAQDLAAEADKGVPGLLAGRPEGLKLKIIKALDRPLRGPISKFALKRGLIGEVAVAGRHVQKGYLNDEAATLRNKIFDRGEVWHRTGDAGYLDRKGRLFLAGRVSQRVLRGGKTWWNLLAEQKALRLEGISFAAYLPGKDRRGKESVLLCLEGQATEAAARKAVAPFPVDQVLCLERLPRDPRHASKLDRDSLLKQLGLS